MKKMTKIKGKDKKTYFIEIKCINCKKRITFEIPFGVEVENHLHWKKCGYCGCFVVENYDEEYEGDF